MRTQGAVQRDFSTDAGTREIRPVVDQMIGRWYWAVDPAVEKSLKRDNANKGFGFTPAVKAILGYRFGAMPVPEPSR